MPVLKVAALMVLMENGKDIFIYKDLIAVLILSSSSLSSNSYLKNTLIKNVHVQYIAVIRSYILLTNLIHKYLKAELS